MRLVYEGIILHLHADLQKGGKSDEDWIYIAYGLEAVAEGHVCRQISDISVDAAAVRRLAMLCNQCQLDIHHLDDVVEDWLV